MKLTKCKWNTSRSSIRISGGSGRGEKIAEEEGGVSDIMSRWVVVEPKNETKD